MFTGIVEEIGRVKEASPDHLAIEARKVLEDVGIGDSIAVNGVCLTVTSLGNSVFSVDVMPETLRCTNLGELRYGDRTNLERALMVGRRLGGHLVLGHVDDTGKVISVVPEEAARIMRIWAPAKLMPYVAGKGFIAVDGVSLTIADLDDSSFSVSLVAYTLEHTTLGDRKPGDRVNLEADVIARYVKRLKQRSTQGLTSDFLAGHGFLSKSLT
jgi:riboflavin synthase